MLRLLDGTDLLSFENRCEASATAVLTYSSLMINDVEHFFMYPLAVNRLKSSLLSADGAHASL